MQCPPWVIRGPGRADSSSGLVRIDPIAIDFAVQSKNVTCHSAGSLDVAILAHMHHEIAQPYALLYNLVPSFKPGARIGIVGTFAPTSCHVHDGERGAVLRWPLFDLRERRQKKSEIASPLGVGLMLRDAS